MGRIRMMLAAVVAAGAVAAVTAPVASGAVTQTFSTDQSEFPPDANGAFGPNQGTYFSYYLGGMFYNRGVYDVRVIRAVPQTNYFSFDIRSACEASAVTLRLVRGSEGGLYEGSLFGGADYTMNGVTTPASVVNRPHAAEESSETPGNVGFYTWQDMQDGPVYGSGSWPLDGSPSDVLSFPLNQAGIAGFNNARDGFFTIGGEGGGRSYFTHSGGFPGASRLYIFSGVSDPAKLVVTCALPTSKEQCKQGGWRDFGVFKNQGDCVRFVATKGKNQPGGTTG